MKEKENIINNASENSYPSTTYGFLIVVIAYAAAGVGVIVTGTLLDNAHPILIAGIADVIATCIVFVFSVIMNNSSIYDPYWSVAPPVIAAFWFLNTVTSGVVIEERTALLRIIAALFIVLLWASRLTYNWAHQWKGLGHEDWRYVNFRNNAGKLYWPVSFLGIHLFPTLMVFGGCLSLYPAMTRFTEPFSTVDIAAIIVAGGAILLETLSDKQLYEFRKNRTDSTQLCEQGLWRLSRHPNYLGEILFWWGLFLFGLSAAPEFWWTIIGPVCITLLFLFISVPMMEDREILRKPYYENYQKRTSRLIPWFPRD